MATNKAEVLPSPVRPSQTTQTYFDLLPAELILLVAKHLSSRDINAWAKSSVRVSDVLQHSPAVISRLCFHVPYFRRMRDCFYKNMFRRCNTFFYFKPTDPEAKANFIVSLAEKIPVGGRLVGSPHLIVILADGIIEADLIYDKLRLAKHNTYLSVGFVPEHLLWQFERDYHREMMRNFLVLVDLDVNLREHSFAAIINAQQPENVHDFLEVNSFNPRRIYQLLWSNEEGFEVWKKISQFLEPYTGNPPPRGHPLQVSRELFIQKRLRELHRALRHRQAGKRK